MDGDISKDKRLWYKYKMDYDKIIMKDGDPLENLLQAFQAKGMKNYLSVPIEQLPQKRPKDVRRILNSAFAAWLWSRYISGEQFQGDGETFPFQTDKKGTIIEKIDDYYIVWVLEPRMLVEGNLDLGEVYGSKMLTAESIILKYSDGFWEARASKKGLRIIRERFQELGVNKLTATLSEDEITGNIESILTKKIESITVTEIELTESALQEKSRLVISNDFGVHNDMVELKSKHVLPEFSIIDVKSFELRMNETGQMFKLQVKLLDEGYLISLRDMRIPQTDRERMRDILNSVGIHTDDTLYPYEIKSQLSIIFNKILSGSEAAFNEYLDKLEGDIVALIKRIITWTDVPYSVCNTCGRTETLDGECLSCGSTDLKEEKEKKWSANRDAITDEVLFHLNMIGKSFEVEKTNFLNVTFKKASKSEIECVFQKSTTYGNIPRNTPYVFHLLVTGGEPIPEKYDDYLLNCGLILFGNAVFREKNPYRYGSLDLFQLLYAKPDDLRKIFADLVDNTLSRTDGILLQLCLEARNRLKNPNYYSSIEPKSARAKEFERDVFYILRRLFSLSTRYGRIAKRESDGLVTFAGKDHRYFVSSFDAKYSDEEYDLDSEEKKKAVFYILDENMNDAIYSLTDTKGIRSHLIIGNSFKQAQLSTFGEDVRKLLKLTAAGESFDNVPIVFIETNELLSLFDAYNLFSDDIRGDSTVNQKYHDMMGKLLSGSESWKVIKAQDVDDIKEGLVEITPKRFLLEKLSSQSAASVKKKSTSRESLS
jgi:hypothetical protein